MGKKKSIESDELIRLLNEYRIDYPGEKIKIPRFGDYIRSKGVNVQDHTIRRSVEFREYLDSVNIETEKEIETDIVTYKTIDVDAFLEKNHTKEKLREAIIIRDQYYAQIAARAAEAINERKKLEKRVEDLEGAVSELKRELSHVQAKADNADIRQKNKIISKLRALLASYVYPDAANAILKKEGILEVVNSIVSDDVIEEKTITAETEVNVSKYTSLNGLLEGFDE